MDLGGFGNMMKQFDDMSRMMHSDKGPDVRGGAGMQNMGSGQYACQSFAMCSRMGPDGKMHTERFANSEVGNRQHRIREAQQAYSNSSTGMDKMGLERQLGDRARKVVRERDRNTAEERSTEMFRGMDESGRDAFSRDFGAQAHHMPAHSQFNAHALMGPSPTNGGARHSLQAGRGAAALEDRGPRHHSLPSRRR